MQIKPRGVFQKKKKGKREGKKNKRIKKGRTDITLCIKGRLYTKCDYFSLR